MKEIYVKGIVQDYDKNINSINKYLFSENERLNAIIDDLEDKIDKAIEYIKTCNDKEELESMFLNESYISNYGAKELLEILGGNKDEN